MSTPEEILDMAASMLEQRTPRLAEAEVEALVSAILAKRAAYLGANAEHGSPLYIIEPDILVNRAARFVSAFRHELPDVRVYYAVKSNNHPAVARTLADEGLGLDVSSGLELQLALDAGVDDIVFSGPGKTTEELRLAAEHHDRVTVLMDSASERDRLECVAAAMDVTVRAGIRLNTGAHGIWRKFGIPMPDLPGFLDDADGCSHVLLRGLQSHVSWNLDPGRQVDFIRSLGAMLAALPEKRQLQMEFIDLGGGFWPPQGEWLQEAGTPAGTVRQAVMPQANPPFSHFKRPATDIAGFAAAIVEAARTHIFPHVSCRICLEPGRWLCNDAMHVLLTVIDKKADDLLITDAGTNAIGWERFETDYVPVINLSRPSIAEHACLVMGSLCTPHDIWGYSYRGAGAEPGDVLLMPNQGAYTYSLRQEFIKPLPRTALVRAS